MTRNEKLLAGTIGGLFVVYLAYAYLLSPYLDSRVHLVAEIQKVEDQQRHDQQLLANKSKVAADWKALTAGTLKTDPAQATSEVSVVLYKWAADERFKLQALKADLSKQKGDFKEIRFQLAGEGSSGTLAAFLFALETTNLPLLIDDVRVSARKEGINDLSVVLNVTALVFSPPATTKPANKSTAAKGETL